jgi:hypothetical protein
MDLATIRSTASQETKIKNLIYLPGFFGAKSRYVDMQGPSCMSLLNIDSYICIDLFQLNFHHSPLPFRYA